MADALAEAVRALVREELSTNNQSPPRDLAVVTGTGSETKGA